MFKIHPNTLVAYSLLFFLFCSCGKEKVELPWEEQISNTNSALTSVYFTDPNTGHVSGGDTWYQGYYLSTTDGGANWKVDTISDSKMYRIDFTPSGAGAVVGNNGYLYRKPSANDDWTFYRLPRWDVLRDIHITDHNLALAVGGIAFQNGVIMRMEGNAIVTDIDTFPNEISAVYLSDAETAHAAGYGIVLRSDDGGKSWNRLDIEGDFFRSIHFPTAEVGYIVGSGGTIMKTTNAGQDWSKIRKGEKIGVSDVPFRDVFFVDEEHGYVVGEGGVFWRTINGGDDWQVVKDFPDADLLSVHAVDGHGFIVSEEGRIFHFQD